MILILIQTPGKLLKGVFPLKSENGMPRVSLGVLSPLKVTLKELLYVYSDPARDSREHNISAVYTAEASGSPTAGDDAADAQLFSLSDLPELVFDHAQIVADYARFAATGVRPKP